MHKLDDKNIEVITGETVPLSVLLEDAEAGDRFSQKRLEMNGWSDVKQHEGRLPTVKWVGDDSYLAGDIF